MTPEKSSSDRYAGSTLITSQLPLSTWHDVIGEPTFADAILTALMHNAYRLELSGHSLRKTMAKTGDENCRDHRAGPVRGGDRR